jgi:hypothetical protein
VTLSAIQNCRIEFPSKLFFCRMATKKSQERTLFDRFESAFLSQLLTDVMKSKR